MNPFHFLFDDWQKIPQNIRYFFLAGAFLIFNSWLLDHWGLTEPYLFWGLEIRQIGYNLGLSIILIGFFFLLFKQLLYFRKILWFRWKYPLRNLGDKYFLIWFNGKLLLFDQKEKRRYHIFPFETAQDLLFVGAGKFTDKSFESSTLVEVREGHSIDVKKYKDGGGINTRN